MLVTNRPKHYRQADKVSWHRFFLLLTGLLFAGGQITERAYAQKTARVLHINSYHPGYTWSERITQGIQSRLIVEDVELDVFHMDSFRNSSTPEIQSRANLAIQRIKDFAPDVVITSNDIASRYVLKPLLPVIDTPFVFAGLHANPDEQNFPAEKVTGIVESAMIEPLIDLLSQYAGGKRIGLLSIDTETGRNLQKQYEDTLKGSFEQVHYAQDFDNWKRNFSDLQEQVDLFILVDPTGLSGWDMESARMFIRDQSRIPIGATDQWMAPLSLITIAKVPQEQGWWAADIAMKLINGASPQDIPITKNQEAKLFINFAMAEALEIIFSTELIEIGTKVDS